MSKKYYDLFTDFYKTTVEKATDADVCFIMNAITDAAKARVKENNSNSGMDPRNKKLIRDFFEEFLLNGNDNDAIYLIEVIKSACKKISEDPNGVAKFVEGKKAEAKKNGKKD